MPATTPIVFVANRGEIARRILRTAKRMGFKTAVAYADQDRELPFVRESDLSFALNGRSSLETYLNHDKIVDAAKKAGATLLHPGYGFLSENPEFVESVGAAGIRFVGPSARSMRLLGDKVGARAFLKNSKIPLLPFVESRSGEDAKALWRRAMEIPFPLLIKPAAGGGGKGMFKVDNENDFLSAVESSQRLALSAFKDARIFVERFMAHARHIEVQVVRDAAGETFIFGERECSLQRRHQKVIEEAPCVFLPIAVRERIYEASRELARLSDYRNAGTIEWIWDGANDIYFLEVNARLQVEHPVTEEIFGVDLVECQLRVAQGESLRGLHCGGPDSHALQPGIQKPLPSSHAIEARLCAEDPWENFIPSGGKIRKLFLPNSLRIDFGFSEGNEIPSEFDSLIGKVIARGATRDEARQKLIEALQKTVVMGPTTNRAFLIRLLESESFVKGQIYTKLIDENPVTPNWVDSFRLLMTGEFQRRREAGCHARGGVGDFETAEEQDLDLFSPWGAVATAPVGGADENIFVETLGDRHFIHLPHDDWSVKRHTLRRGAAHHEADSHELRCPLPAKVIKILVSAGETTQKNQAVMVIEAMKMEITLKSPCSGLLEKVEVREGDMMAVDSVVMVWNPKE